MSEISHLLEIYNKIISIRKFSQTDITDIKLIFRDYGIGIIDFNWKSWLSEEFKQEWRKRIEKDNEGFSKEDFEESIILIFQDLIYDKRFKLTKQLNEFQCRDFGDKEIINFYYNKDQTLTILQLSFSYPLVIMNLFNKINSNLKFKVKNFKSK